PFIVMEVLTGETLYNLLERGDRLPWTRVVQILLPIAGALSAAHEKGIVHRDLKPDNIVLVDAAVGRLVPKVIDFGIATLPQRDQADDDRSLAGLIGTPEYMSPEQV